MEAVAKVNAEWKRLKEIHDSYGVSFETIIHARELSAKKSDMVRLEHSKEALSEEDIRQPFSYPPVEPKNLDVMEYDDVCT